MDLCEALSALICLALLSFHTTTHFWHASASTMAAAETRRLLGKSRGGDRHESADNLGEQLMGEQLMNGTDQRAPQLSITDPKVCRSYLVGNCPHDLFTNTKNELGPCAKVHNEALKTEYQEADAEQKRKWGFDFDYMRDMQHHIDSCNRKIDSAQRRLEKTPEEIRQTNALVNSHVLILWISEKLYD